MTWAINGTPDTLVSAGDTLQITDLTATQFNVFLCHISGDSPGLTNSGNDWSFNGDITGSDYATRFSLSGTSDATAVSQNEIFTRGNRDFTAFEIMYMCSINGKEKLCILHHVDESNSGAGSAPVRTELVAKYVQTGDITRVDVEESDEDGGTQFDTDSNLSALGDIVPPVPPVGGWVELARGTTGILTNTLTVSGLSSKRYYMLLANPLNDFQISTGWRLGNSTIDTSSIYAFRRGRNSSETIFPTADFAGFVADGLVTSNQFGVGFVGNVSDKEKLLQSSGVAGTAGAGTAPNRYKTAGKWTNTSNVADVVGLFNFGSGAFDTGTELVVLGWDPTDTHTSNFWEELASVELTSAANNLSSGTIPAKKYLWIQAYQIAASGSPSGRITFNDDTGSNYATRFSTNGGADATSTSRNDILNTVSGTTTTNFTNYFVINNSTNEKFVITRNIQQSTAGAANAPTRTESVSKWTNTSAQITKIDYDNADTGDFAGGSFLKVWGSN